MIRWTSMTWLLTAQEEREMLDGSGYSTIIPTVERLPSQDSGLYIFPQFLHVCKSAKHASRKWKEGSILRIYPQLFIISIYLRWAFRNACAVAVGTEISPVIDFQGISEATGSSAGIIGDTGKDWVRTAQDEAVPMMDRNSLGEMLGIQPSHVRGVGLGLGAIWHGGLLRIGNLGGSCWKDGVVSTFNLLVCV